MSSSRMQRFPVFSPDGRHLAFDSTRSGTYELWMSDADGSNPVRMNPFRGASTGSPQWSPDGRQIAFVSRVSGTSAALSPDGKSLLFSQVDEIASDIMLIEGFR